MSSNKEYEILLFYKYVHLDDPPAEMDAQRQICESLGLKGRIIVAAEGINATVEGTVKNTQKYIDYLQADDRFADIHFKRSEGIGDAFPRLSVKVRPEIVSTHLKGAEDVDPTKVTGTHLDPEELHQWFEEGREFYLVDMRNDYEHKSGHFEGSVLPSFKNFYDLKEIVKEIEHLKDKTVVTVCTGGVRCEKASGYLITQGFKDVYQLNGGIVSYMEKYPNQNFKGKLFVFDKRMTMGFNLDDPEHETIAHCELCGKESERYVNCANDACHRLMIACKDCGDEDGKVYCSPECKHGTGNK